MTLAEIQYRFLYRNEYQRDLHCMYLYHMGHGHKLTIHERLILKEITFQSSTAVPSYFVARERL